MRLWLLLSALCRNSNAYASYHERTDRTDGRAQDSFHLFINKRASADWISQMQAYSRKKRKTFRMQNITSIGSTSPPTPPPPPNRVQNMKIGRGV